MVYCIYTVINGNCYCPKTIIKKRKASKMSTHIADEIKMPKIWVITVVVQLYVQYHNHSLGKSEPKMKI